MKRIGVITLILAMVFAFLPLSSMAEFESEVDGEDISWVEDYPGFASGVDYYGPFEKEISFENSDNRRGEGENLLDGIVLNADIITIAVNESTTLIPYINGANPNTTVFWLSEDSTISILMLHAGPEILGS